MSQINQEPIRKLCDSISDAAQDSFPYLELHFLIYEQGKKTAQIAKLLPKLKNHPSFEDAASILKFRTAGKDGSHFLGIAESEEAVAFSLKKRRRSLAFISIDLSKYSSEEEVVFDIHSLAAQMFETLADLQLNPLAHGMTAQTKRKRLDICRTNFKTDIYAALQLSRDGLYDAPLQLAKRRCIETITPQSFLRPEDYPFPLALDVTNYAIENQISSTVVGVGKSQTISQYQLAEQIAACFEKENIYTWAQFAEHSQTLAWSGFSASQILGAAVHTSTDPFIKAIGHMLAELTNLSPATEEHLPSGYNPFVADEINAIRHERGIDDAFEMALIHSMEADSHIPLLRAATSQNEGLIKGKILGWCASALQSSAKAYVGAKERGVPPVQAARLEFQSARKQLNWSVIRSFGEHIVHLYRASEAVTLSELAKLSQSITDAKFMFESLSLTIEDPNYLMRLESATAMPILSNDPTPTPAFGRAVGKIKTPQTSFYMSNVPTLSLDLGGSPALPQQTHPERKTSNDEGHDE
jgi:hypothetical protein